jgi:hypothetical protein
MSVNLSGKITDDTGVLEPLLLDNHTNLYTPFYIN